MLKGPQTTQIGVKSRGQTECTNMLMTLDSFFFLERNLYVHFRHYLSFYGSDFDNLGLVGKLRSCSIDWYRYRQYRRYLQRPVSAYRQKCGIGPSLPIPSHPFPKVLSSHLNYMVPRKADIKMNRLRTGDTVLTEHASEMGLSTTDCASVEGILAPSTTLSSTAHFTHMPERSLFQR